MFPDENADWHNRIVKQNALHLMKFGGEMLQARFKTYYFGVKKIYVKEGRVYLEKLIDSGTGFIIVTCHLGNWEYGGAYIAYKYKTIYAPVFVEESQASKALNWIRERRNVVFLETSYNPRVSAKCLLQMIGLLNRGEIVYILADQEALAGNYKGELFGKELSIFGGPFILGQKTKKPVLPMYTFRDERNKIALCFEKPFYLNGENLKNDIAKVIGFFEKKIREHPDQYIWSQDRW